MRQRLENRHLRVEIAAEEGGRICSIVSHESGIEFLLQSRPGRVPVARGMQADFRDGPCAGIEECLPTVGACDSATDGGAVPDHGDFWQISWDIEPSTDIDSICMVATGFSRPLRFRKRASLQGRAVEMHYSVENVGCEPTSLLYACHPLFAIEPADRIVLPDEVTTLQLHSSRKGRLGERGALVRWPHNEPAKDLSRVLDVETGIAEMLYTPRLKKGWCGLYRSVARQGIALQFDASRLPWLGVWLCYGGWPEPGDGGDVPRQYAVALEPTTAACGTLQQAQEAGDALSLPPGASFEWSLRFSVSDPEVSLAQFRSFASDPEVPLS